MSSWIKSKKDILTTDIMMPRKNIDVSTLSDMPKGGYIIKAHWEKPCPKDPLFLIIVIGVGGTGKSYLKLVNAHQNLLQHPCAVTATTGKASYGIHGCTSHSLLKLPTGPKGNACLG